MYVLVACEESQEVCKAFRKKGHVAFSCDVQNCSGGHPEWHILGDVIPYLNGFCSFETESGSSFCLGCEWDLIIGFPPCTYFTKSGAQLMFPNGVLSEERLKAAQPYKELFFAIYNAQCSKIAIENPIPMKVIGLPPYSMRFNWTEFGVEYSKRTCLWLKNLPPLMPTCFYYDCPKSWVYSSSSSKTRSKTHPVVADQMALQWG